MYFVVDKQTYVSYLLAMKIRDYIKYQLSQADNRLEKKRELAELFGVSEHAIHSWSTGWRHPERKRWNTIVLKTNGIVTLADLASIYSEAA
jgi:DNA-binding transcriptional regulator YdaS (Cro superfamily)